MKLSSKELDKLDERARAFEDKKGRHYATSHPALFAADFAEREIYRERRRAKKHADPFTLTGEAAKEFARLMNNPPPATDNLKRVLRRAKKQEGER